MLKPAQAVFVAWLNAQTASPLQQAASLVSGLPLSSQVNTMQMFVSQSSPGVAVYISERNCLSQLPIPNLQASRWTGGCYTHTQMKLSLAAEGFTETAAHWDMMFGTDFWGKLGFSKFLNSSRYNAESRLWLSACIRGRVQVSPFNKLFFFLPQTITAWGGGEEGTAIPRAATG